MFINTKHLENFQFYLSLFQFLAKIFSIFGKKARVKYLLPLFLKLYLCIANRYILLQYFREQD
jgi:hypothetical protein